MNTYTHREDPSLSIACLVNQNDQPVGVGFLISDQHILTCAHVVNAALGRDQRAQERPSPDTSIVVKFPTLPGRGDVPFRRGHVVEWHAPPARPRFEFGDIACVALSKARPQRAVPAVVSVPIPGPAQRVRVFGYPRDPPRPEGHWISCDLASGVTGGFLQLDVSSTTGLRAQPGYSGSPVWVESRGVVVGMLAIAPYGGGAGDAYAISARDFASIYRSVSGSDPAPPAEVVTAKRACKAVSAELDQWRSFISDKAGQGWIDYYQDEMPSANAWDEYGDFLSHIAPEPVIHNLMMVYRYFEALIKAHERIESWTDTASSVRNARLDKLSDEEAGASLGEYAARYFAAGVIHVIFQGGEFVWSLWRMERKQLKDTVSVDRLRALPDSLSALIRQLDVIAAGSSPVAERMGEDIALPSFPLVEIKKDASIRFTLVPIGQPDVGSSGTPQKVGKRKPFRGK